MDWKGYFATLESWTRLPGFRLEPRIDSLFGHFLPRSAVELLGFSVKAVVPAFPTHPDAAAAPEWCTGFLVIGTDRNWIVEIRGNSDSDPERDRLLDEVSGGGTARLVDTVFRSAQASEEKRRFAHLLAELGRAGLMDATGRWTGRNPSLEAIHIQPREPVPPRRGVGFRRISEWLESRPDAGEFERSFAEFLRDRSEA